MFTDACVSNLTQHFSFGCPIYFFVTTPKSGVVRKYFFAEYFLQPPKTISFGLSFLTLLNMLSLKIYTLYYPPISQPYVVKLQFEWPNTSQLIPASHFVYKYIANNWNTCSRWWWLIWVCEYDMIKILYSVNYTSFALFCRKHVLYWVYFLLIVYFRL